MTTGSRAVRPEAEEDAHGRLHDGLRYPAPEAPYYVPTGDEVAIDEGGCTLILRTLADEGATDRIVEAAQKWAAAHGRTPQSARWQYTAGKKKILVLEIAFEDP